jgi:uncharacterized membrane protein
MKSFNKIFFRGLITLLPITITIYILYSAVIILENLLGSVLRALLPEAYYIPGFGLLLTLTLIYAFGLLLNNYLTGRFLMSLEERLTKVPFIKAVYSPLRDLMNLFQRGGQKNMGSVVLVTVGETGVRMIGIITRENFSDLKLGDKVRDRVAVYIPFSYALGGYTVLVPRSQITEIDLPIEKAMSLAITGWVKADTLSETENRHDSHLATNHPG